REHALHRGRQIEPPEPPGTPVDGRCGRPRLRNLWILITPSTSLIERLERIREPQDPDRVAPREPGRRPALYRDGLQRGEVERLRLLRVNEFDRRPLRRRQRGQ